MALVPPDEAFVHSQITEKNNLPVVPTPKGRDESHVTSLTDGPQTDTDTSKASDSQTRCGGAAYRMSYRKMCGTESKNDASVGSSEYQRVMVCSGCQTPPLCESGWRDLNPRPLRSE